MRPYFNKIGRDQQVPRLPKHISVFLILVAFLSPSILYSYTVAVFVDKMDNERLRSAVEAGAMEELFNTGHIAFNALPNTLELGANGNWQWLRTVAYDMGADHLLWIDPSHTFLDQYFTIQSTFVFIEIARPGSLVESHINQQSNYLQGAFSPEYNSYTFGKQVVREILMKIGKNADL